MVGELQGEHQFPPESARKGRRCKLVPMEEQDYNVMVSLADDPYPSRYDISTGCAVYYLD